MPQGMLNLFIPTTPNPTTGWYAVVAEADVMDLSMSIEDAFKVVISGGIVKPGNAVAALDRNSSPIVDSPLASMLSAPIIDSPEERLCQREDNL
jgi:uncharacterized membrane protein